MSRLTYEMCKTLSHIIIRRWIVEAEAERRHNAKHHLRPTQDGEDLAKDAVQRKNSLPRLAVFHDMKLEEDAKADLSKEVKGQEVRKTAVRCVVEGTSAMVMLETTSD